LNSWKNYFYQQWNVHGVNDVGLSEMYIVEPLVNETSSFEVKIPTEKLRRYQSPCTDKILAELIQEEGNTLHSEITNLYLE
jgi:hypothetical protein